MCWKQLLQGANTDLFNPSVPTAHNSERQNLPFRLQITNLVRASVRIFISMHPRH